ncbi:RCC1 repeat-containing protein [Archangium sp.]|uniref:RCC1 domain-containing protein n=1 Tax=Archangium sp. TaxID=1872627 RepID=UPI00286BE7CD|nr:RCC1 repeat-containing protein [Archangium sp.]
MKRIAGLWLGLLLTVACDPAVSPQSAGGPPELAESSAALVATAVYDSTLGAPRCSAVAAGCDTGTSLVRGRGTVGPESNAPNTLGSTCADDSTGVFHSDESLDRVRVFTPDGSDLAPGKQVTLEATVWAYSDYAADKLDFYTTTNVTSPSWTYLTTLTPAGTGAQVLTASYTLPQGSTVQAVRAVFRYGGTSAGPCVSGSYADRDDLVFAVQPPVRRANLSVAAGMNHSVARRSDGTVWAWGANQAGQVGDGGSLAERRIPVRVQGLSGVEAVEAGRDYSLVLKEDGTVWGWGTNSNGELGDGTSTSRLTPTQAAGLSGVVALATLQVHTLALKGDGTVWAWGFNGSGQLGTGSAGPSRSTPAPVPGLTHVVDIDTGSGHSLALKSDGTVWAWGYNAYGQLGDGTTTPRYVPVQVPGLTGVVAIAAGELHSLALKSDGTVLAWGRNGNGQLGDGTITSSRLSPAPVPGLTDVRTLGAGYNHSLAVLGNGTVWSWGLQANDSGLTVNQPTPTQLVAPPGVRDLSGGQTFSLTMTEEGAFWSWGLNPNGQLGDNTLSARLQPVRVLFPSPITSLSFGPGPSHALALMANGDVWTWGLNATGQAGIGSEQNQVATPTIVPSLAGVSAVAAGSGFSLALKGDGTVWAWGVNSSGQLGNGVLFGTSTTPAQVPNLSGVTAIAAGHTHVLALKGDGTVWMWGSSVGFSATVPTQVASLTQVVAIAAGQNFSVALKSDGTVWGWGENGSGQLADGTSVDRPAPVQVPGLSGITAIAPGTSHVLALKSDGSAWSWGSNFSGELGRAGLSTSATPLSGLTGVVAVAAGGRNSLALKNDGTFWAWGSNTYGQLGDGTFTHRTTPVQGPVLSGVKRFTTDGIAVAVVHNDGSAQVWGGNMRGQFGNGAHLRTYRSSISGLGLITDVSAGEGFTLARRSDGSVWSWGSNAYKQLGHATLTYRNAPAGVAGISNVSRVAAGNFHSLALKSDGTVWSWGYNAMGQLGDGSTTQRVAPAQVSGLTGVFTAVDASRHSLALRSDGTVWAWGNNNYGQLGDGTTTNRPLPVQVSGLTDVTAIAAGGFHSLALKSDGTVWAWGAGYAGQIGNGSTLAQSRPVLVPGLSRVTAISAGYTHSLALKLDETVWAWGDNQHGQLGDGSITNRSSPIQVVGLTGVVRISAGGTHSLAHKNDASLWSWGSNSFGQLADNTTLDRRTPVQEYMGATGIGSLSAGRFYHSHSVLVNTSGNMGSWGNNDHGQLGLGSDIQRSSPAALVLLP